MIAKSYQKLSSFVYAVVNGHDLNKKIYDNDIKLLIFNAYLKVCPFAFLDYRFMNIHKFLFGHKTDTKCEGCWNCSGILEDINYSNIYKVNGECQESEKEISRALNKMMTGRN